MCPLCRAPVERTEVELDMDKTLEVMENFGEEYRERLQRLANERDGETVKLEFAYGNHYMHLKKFTWSP